MPSVALAHPPDRRRILVDLGCHRRHAHPFCTGQEDAGPLRHALERVTVAQEAFEFSDIVALQLDWFRFAATHGFAPQRADTLRYHRCDRSASNSLQDLCNNPLAAHQPLAHRPQ